MWTDTNNYTDLPDGVEIELRVTLGDRVTAECGNVHHCTLANCMCRDRSSGVVALGLRGVSRRMVSMRLDPEVHEWADPERVYRGRLDGLGEGLTLELDQGKSCSTTDKMIRRALKAQAAALPDGLDTVFAVVRILPPLPSMRKNYRARETGTDVRRHRGDTPKAIERRKWMRTERLNDEDAA